MPITSLDKNTIRLLTTTQVITSVYSAVKELVENAFDANAENIEVNLVDNGTSLIEVKDDGDGISNEDAVCMALPAFTSKISCFEDLGMLQTYGFRGEALNALCKIAEVVVITKTEKDEVGRLYNMDNNGNIETSKLHPRQKGTTIQIKQIFKHFPVRRKIITNTKKTNQDVKLLEVLLKSFGICNPTVRIHYRVNNDVVFIKPNLGSIKAATEYVIGSKIMSDMKWITYEEAEVTVQMMIPNKEIRDINEICQVNNSYIFVNNRPIKCKDIEKMVNGIISEYFSQKLTVKKKPIFLLHILVDPMDIDINLEPNKDAILFKNQQQILDVITKHLTSFYCIQTEKETIQDATDISNCYENISSTSYDKTLETEWPASKKRKLSPCIEEPIEESRNKKLNEKISSDNNINNTVDKNNISEDELQAISNYLNTTAILHESSMHNEDVNCISHNKLMHDSINNQNNVVYTNDSLLHELDVSNEKSNSQPTINTEDNQNNHLSESISQLPVVDLGEDFELDAILNKESNVNIQTDKMHNAQNNENNNLNTKEKYSLETWSKGQVDGLKGGTDVKPCSMSLDTSAMESTFTKFAKDARAEIMKENPKQSPVEVARKITDMWKHLPSQEHGYYQDLAREERENKEEKTEIKKKIDADIKKNKKRLLRLLENMKNTNTKKTENLVMRTIVPWDISIDKVTTSFQNRCNYDNMDHVVGSVSINLWIIRNSAQLWILDVSHILKGLNITDLTIDKIQAKDVDKFFKQWLLEKKDMSMIFPIHTLT